MLQVVGVRAKPKKNNNWLGEGQEAVTFFNYLY